jgi:hypothetical protein
LAEPLFRRAGAVRQLGGRCAEPRGAAASRLFVLACKVILRQPRIHQLALDRTRRQASFAQRTKGLGFIDDIEIAAEPIDATQSALAIYSRARLGLWDLGVNRRRALRWMREICAEVSPAVPPLESVE